MTPSQSSLWLRFESGPLGGERIQLAPGTVTIGRRPGNAILLAHASVSGKHAEIRIEGEGVRLVDLGSTNGSRVNGVQVNDAILIAGCKLRFGAVEAVLEEGAADGLASPGDPDEIELEEEITLEEEPVAAPDPAPRTSAPRTALAGLPDSVESDALETVSADVLERSSSRSPVALVVILLFLAGGGFAAWRFLLHGESGAAAPAVAPVPGNLVADGSFEDPESQPWSSAEAAPVAFFVDSSSASTGSAGLGCTLGAGEWTLAASPSFPLAAHRGVDLSLDLSAAGSIVARAGIELLSSSEDASAAPTIAWAPARTGGDGFAPVSLAFQVPPGVDRGRVVVAAVAGEGGGDLSLDDVVCLTGAGGKNAGASFEEYSLVLLGEPGSTAQLQRSGRVLFPSISLSSWAEEALTGDAFATWHVEPKENGLALVPEDTTGSGEVVLWLRVGTDEGSGFATLGPGGYREHPGVFDREDATDLLLGSGVNRIRVGFGAPAHVVASQSAGEVRIRVELSEPGPLEFQLSFKTERQEAARLARRARALETDGEVGASIAVWSELLDRFPFEAELVAEAQGSRARLEGLGYAELERLRRDFDRARFFELADLYASLRTSALDLATRFEGSETEIGARLLADQLERSRAELGNDGAQQERERLAAVLSALSREGPETYGKEIKAALEGALGAGAGVPSPPKNAADNADGQSQ